VFTAHEKDINLYRLIQSELGGIGRFQRGEGNVIRDIVGDIEGLKIVSNLIHNKFRTPKNITFNKLIKFMNEKYALNTKNLVNKGHGWVKTSFSQIDNSDLSSNS
jgi:hypothetical protein